MIGCVPCLVLAACLGAALQERAPALAAAAELLARGETAPATTRLRAWCEEADAVGAGERWLAATELLLSRGQAAAAEEFAVRSQELLPDRYEPFAYLGTCYLLEEQAERALEHFRGGLERYPDEPDLYFQLAMACSHQQRLGEAAALFQEALERAPGQPVYHFWAGDLDAKLGRLDAAEEHLRLALGDPGVRPDATWKLGEILGLRGRDEEAERRLRDGLSGPSPLGRRRAALHLGVFLFERGRYAEAEAQLGSVVVATEDSRVAWYYLARTQRELGQTTEARSSLERYRALQRQEDSLENDLLLEQRAALREAADAKAGH